MSTYHIRVHTLLYTSCMSEWASENVDVVFFVAGFSEAECDRQRHLLEARIVSLEQEAYDLAGHVFSLASPADIAQVTSLSSVTIPHTLHCFHFEI